jgi:hypothetical protein
MNLQNTYPQVQAINFIDEGLDVFTKAWKRAKVKNNSCGINDKTTFFGKIYHVPQDRPSADNRYYGHSAPRIGGLGYY